MGGCGSLHSQKQEGGRAINKSCLGKVMSPTSFLGQDRGPVPLSVIVVITFTRTPDRSVQILPSLQTV